MRIPEILHQHAEEASKDNISHLEFLDKLLQEEILSKHERYIQLRTRTAHLPYHKTLDQFDFSFQPKDENCSSILLENKINNTRAIFGLDPLSESEVIRRLQKYIPKKMYT